MPKRPCIACGKLTDRSYCATCHPDRSRKRITPGRTTGRQQRFREQVLRAAGHRCEAIIDGVRCEATTGLEAHHLDPLRDTRSYDPSRGVALCRRCHHLAERAA